MGCLGCVTAPLGVGAACTAGRADQHGGATLTLPPQVRAAVRTLTLNVYQIGDAAVQAFVVSQPASNYFTELAIFIAEQCQARAGPPGCISAASVFPACMQRRSPQSRSVPHTLG